MSTRSSSTCSTSPAARSCSRTRTTSPRSATALPRQRARALARGAARGRAGAADARRRARLPGRATTSALHVDLKLTTRLDEVADALVRHGLAERAVVSSFHRESLARLRRGRSRGSRSASRTPRTVTASRGGGRSSRRSASARWRCAAPIVARVPAMIERAGAAALMLHHAVVSAAAVERAHAAGAAVWAWTVDDPAELARLDAAGVDAVITNDPEIFSRPWLHCGREARTRISPCSSACAAAGVLSAVLLAATPSRDRADGHGRRRPARRRRRRRRPRPPRRPRRRRRPIPRPTTIAAGVTVGGQVLVGGLSPAEATAEVKAFFARPLTLQLRQGDAARDAEAAGRIGVRRRRRQARPHRAPGRATCR